MKRRSIVWAGILLIAAAASPLAAEPLSQDDRIKMLKHLDRTQALFLDSVKGLSEAQWNFKPAEDRWSIAECAEHLAVSEEFLRTAVAGMLTQDPASAEQVAAGGGREDEVEKFMLDRSQTFQAPEPVQPSKGFESMDETLSAFRTQRTATLEMVEEVADLRGFTQEHPAFGQLDAYGWLFFLSAHTERHTLQINEVKEAEGFPKR